MRGKLRKKTNSITCYLNPELVQKLVLFQCLAFLFSVSLALERDLTVQNTAKMFEKCEITLKIK
jgi:hypothetical protein